MPEILAALARTCRGATAVEYGLVAAFLAIAMVAALPAPHDAATGDTTGLGQPAGGPPGGARPTAP